MRRLIPVVLVASLVACAQGDFEAQRERMARRDVEQRGVRDRRVLEAMRKTPRHLFVPEALRTMAYADQPLPIGYGQTISQPYIVAFMTELLEPKPDHKALEIGTGSGYQAAVLSHLVNHLCTIEIVPELARSSAQLLKELGYKNVTVRHGDGYKGWPEQAPFDRILLTAAPPEIPQALLEQLKPGGKLVAPVGASVFEQELVVIDKDKNGKLHRRSSLPVRFVPMVPGKN